MVCNEVYIVDNIHHGNPKMPAASQYIMYETWLKRNKREKTTKVGGENKE
jgi:hypothetical protein